jgi:macrolide transport system ATP-binding/permease protein
MAEPVIRIEKVSRTYHVGDIDVYALRDVSLTVEHGEFIAIMGASGSGKSTLMSILGCLDRPTGGRYWFDGIDVAQLAEPDLAGLRSERLGFVFQSFNLLPRTSAIDNVALPLLYAMSGQGHARVRFERARAVLDKLGLRDRERNTPGQLSGGQQQRVAIARALINQPSLLLADEPTGNLDTRNSNEIMQALSSLNRDQGVTIIVVTHEPDIAAFADRVLTMRDGQIISDVKNTRRDKAPRPAAEAAGDLLQTREPLTYVGSSGASWPFAWMVVTAAAEAIWRNKMRSALTMLGVFIGVAALIVMVSVGQGANEAVRKEIARLGTNLVVILPGAATSGGARGGSGSASTLTVADVQAIRREAPAAGEVSYLIRQSGQIRFANQNWTTGIQGVSPNYPPMTNWQIAAGRAITPEDERSAALVVVLGETVRRQLFGTFQNPIGATVQAKGVSLRVVGILDTKGQTSFGQDQDDLIMVPFTTAERKILGVAAPSQQQTAINWIYPTPPNPYGLQPRMIGFVNQIYVQAIDQTGIQTAISQATEILARRHRIRPGTINDFSVRNLSQIAETAEGSSRIMALLLAAVASISLVVGGIGIMNILLVSVTERTREIGLRMAIGARRLHVLLQFLAEAIFISVSGGFVGIIIGATLSIAISALTGWPAPISLTAIAGGFLFSAAVGIFFGYYPARKAARLDPIEALRYE